MSADILYAHHGSFSCWGVELLLKELEVEYRIQYIDLHKGEQYSAEFLRLSPRGSVPVLVSPADDNVPRVGANQIRTALKARFPSSHVFKGETDFYVNKIESIPVGHITYGLAFHQSHTKLLRYPYSSGNFFEIAMEYVQDRPRRLNQAALDGPDPESVSALLEAAEEHQTNLPLYTHHAQYETALRSVEQMLQYFEEELGREDRTGLWLGGPQFALADIYLGLLLHRIWQLGMEGEYFADGVRPNLAVYYDRVRRRDKFSSTTRCLTELTEFRVVSEEDAFVDRARMGIGISLVLGGLYLGKKLFKR